jgi:hypothetical protein
MISTLLSGIFAEVNNIFGSVTSFLGSALSSGAASS